MVPFSVVVQLFTGDFPTRSKCSQLINHNGYFACSHCLFRGSRYTHYHAHGIRDTNRKVFIRDPRQQRTQSHINHCVHPLNSVEKSVFGIVESTPLSTTVSVPEQAASHYFHLVLEAHFGKNSVYNTTDSFSVLERCSFFNQFELLLVGRDGSSSLKRDVGTERSTPVFLFFDSSSFLTEWYLILRQNIVATDFVNAGLEEFDQPTYRPHSGPSLRNSCSSVSLIPLIRLSPAGIIHH